MDSYQASASVTLVELTRSRRTAWLIANRIWPTAAVPFSRPKGVIIEKGGDHREERQCLVQLREDKSAEMEVRAQARRRERRAAGLLAPNVTT